MPTTTMPTTTTTTTTMPTTDTAQYWAAPANLNRIKSRSSSWGIYATDGREIALPLNHYALGVFLRQPGGRTAGRALRACRRWLARNPIRFDANMAETYSAGNRADRRLLQRWLKADADGLSLLSAVLAVLPVAQFRAERLNF